jgi:hypothetical protein
MYVPILAALLPLSENSAKKETFFLALPSPPCAPGTCARTSDLSASVRAATGKSAGGASCGGRASAVVVMVVVVGGECWCKSEPGRAQIAQFRAKSLKSAIKPKSVYNCPTGLALIGTWEGVLGWNGSRSSKITKQKAR